MRHRHRLLIFVVIAVVLAVGGLGSLAVGTARESFPQTTGTLTVPVLKGRVEVLRDAHGVPQIYADDAEDLFAAQGFVHAQDRFFEMDVRRHITAGRLSELFGASQVETDSYLRTLGWRRVAEKELPLLSASTRRYLDAYAAGVNAYLSSRTAPELSLEYSVLNFSGPNYTPEAWTALDSLTWLKAMAWDLDGNASDETERAQVTASLGADRAADLFPGYSADERPIVTSGTVVKGTFDPRARPSSRRVAPASDATLPAAAAPALAALGRANQLLSGVLADQRLGVGIGSNSWVIAGSKTTTGKPLLGNDPHLGVSIPSVFEQMGLHCRAIGSRCPFEVTGFTFSGLPGVVIGHTATVSWGLTTSNADTQDTFVEQLRGDEVRVGTTWIPLTVREEQIRVAGESAPRTIRIRSSRHGPLLSDVDADFRKAGEISGAGYGLALQWAALTPSRSMDALLGINAATNFNQFRTAANQLGAPSQNLVYADTAGHIGYQLTGQIPIRATGNGRLPRLGWDRRNDWQGYIPFGQLPYSYDPPAGYVVAANQTVIAGSYPRRLTNGQSYGWRSDRLNSVIGQLSSQGAKVSPDTANRLFADTRIGVATHLAPALLRVRLSDPWDVEGQRSLVGWDYTASADSAAAAYFSIVYYDVLKRTFRDQLPPELWPSDVDRYNAVLTRLLRQPDNPWWDDVTTPQVERRDDILALAMGDARREATSLMSRETSGWRWGSIHRVTLENQTLGQSGVGAVERLFNRGPEPVAGGPAVVNAMGYAADAPYAVTHGPAMRMLVDLSDLDGSRWINQSGNSGHAFHDHYADQFPLWARDQWLSMPSSRAAVEAATVDRLELIPAG